MKDLVLNVAFLWLSIVYLAVYQQQLTYWFDKALR